MLQWEISNNIEKTDYKLYLSGVLGSLIKRDSANFKKEPSKIFAMVFYQMLMHSCFQLH